MPRPCRPAIPLPSTSLLRPDPLPSARLRLHKPVPLAEDAAAVLLFIEPQLLGLGPAFGPALAKVLVIKGHPHLPDHQLAQFLDQFVVLKLAVQEGGGKGVELAAPGYPGRGASGGGNSRNGSVPFPGRRRSARILPGDSSGPRSPAGRPWRHRSPGWRPAGDTPGRDGYWGWRKSRAPGGPMAARTSSG